MGCTKELKEFLDDIDSLNPIEEFARRVNVFNVLGLEKLETRHSFMLAWLFDPNENHGLGDRVLRGVIQHICGNIEMDYSSFLIEREADHIDLLALSIKEKFLLCIENKIKAPETGDQLVTYKRLLDGKYPEFRKVYVFLSPNGRKSSDPENWVSLCYTDVLNIIEKARTDLQTQTQSDLLIQSYMEMMTGDYKQETEKSKEICHKVYQKHRKALNMIFDVSSGNLQNTQSEDIAVCETIYWQHKKAITQIWKNRTKSCGNQVWSVIRKWASCQDETGRIRVCTTIPSNSYVRFTTETMSKYLPDIPGKKSAWNTDNLYFYELSVRKEALTPEQSVRIALSINKKNLPEALRKTYDLINEGFPQHGYGDDYSENFATRIFRISESAYEDQIVRCLDDLLEQLSQFEVALTEYMESMGIAIC